MTDILIRQEGPVGRITLNRPQALNAVTYAMCLEIEAAIDNWRDDPAVTLILIDAEGDRAFSAGGDIAEMYSTGTAGDFSYGRKFWHDEYRMNAKLFEYPKNIVSFLQGFTMGGGVGVGCHAKHRIVGESAQVAMPECGIGLVPDVGGSFILANAPGRVGEYLALTTKRLGPADAIYAGFADCFVPEAKWASLKEELCKSGDIKCIEDYAARPPDGDLANQQADIDENFSGERLGDIVRSLRHSGTSFSEDALKRLSRNSPFSMACAVEIIHRIRGNTTIRRALEMEYRFTYRAMENGDFLEGIRAAIIDKDKSPKWRHSDPEAVPLIEVSKMLIPLGPNTLDLSALNETYEAPNAAEEGMS